MSQKTGASVGAMTIGGTDWVGSCANFDYTFTNEAAESAAINDPWKSPIKTATAFKGSGEFTMSGTANQAQALITAALTSAGTVSFSLASGHGTYSGVALITEVSAKTARHGLQTYTLSIESVGTVSYA